MATEPQSSWSPAEILSNATAAEEHQLLKVRVPPAVAAGYCTPGQYVQLRLDGSMQKPAFMAISSPPPASSSNGDGGGGGDDDNREEKSGSGSSSTFDFLVKCTPASAWLCDLPAGSGMQISPVGGSGFPASVRFDRGIEHVLLFATGSGIAPVRAVIEDSRCLADKRSIKLYYGCRTPERMSYKERFVDWQERHGVEVVPVVSRPDRGWRGATGYVQDTLAKHGVHTPAESTGAVLCGVRGMTDAVKGYLTGKGVAEELVLFNF